jgi:hypothetical protein
MMFWSIVGHASFHTAGPTGPSTIDRSNFLGLVPTCATNSAVYYAAAGGFVSPIRKGVWFTLCVDLAAMANRPDFILSLSDG